MPAGGTNVREEATDPLFSPDGTGSTVERAGRALRTRATRASRRARTGPAKIDRDRLRMVALASPAD
jgi:hypothetical protein